MTTDAQQPLTNSNLAAATIVQQNLPFSDNLSRYHIKLSPCTYLRHSTAPKPANSPGNLALWPCPSIYALPSAYSPCMNADMQTTAAYGYLQQQHMAIATAAASCLTACAQGQDVHVLASMQPSTSTTAIRISKL
eukprot:GHRR01026124.1.p1 GENE.GHRR01026124.1~~GHRR01026124.1.p1  ORF type:complete len:135 (-),score=39.66 GHRR01026124.1:802-1206(-)